MVAAFIFLVRGQHGTRYVGQVEIHSVTHASGEPAAFRRLEDRDRAINLCSPLWVPDMLDVTNRPDRSMGWLEMGDRFYQEQSRNLENGQNIRGWFLAG